MNKKRTKTFYAVSLKVWPWWAQDLIWISFNRIFCLVLQMTLTIDPYQTPCAEVRLFVFLASSKKHSLMYRKHDMICRVQELQMLSNQNFLSALSPRSHSVMLFQVKNVIYTIGAHTSQEREREKWIKSRRRRQHSSFCPRMVLFCNSFRHSFASRLFSESRTNNISTIPLSVCGLVC